MFVIYKIYYLENNIESLVYIGKSTQLLHKRLYQHFHVKNNTKKTPKLNIQLVSKIEYAEIENESDWNIQEIYLINKFSPKLNIDCKAKNNQMTIELEELKFFTFHNYLLTEWKHKQKLKSHDENDKLQEKQRIANVFIDDVNKNKKELNNDDYLDWLNIKKQNNDIGYKYYKELSINKN